MRRGWVTTTRGGRRPFVRPHGYKIGDERRNEGRLPSPRRGLHDGGRTLKREGAREPVLDLGNDETGPYGLEIELAHQAQGALLSTGSRGFHRLASVHRSGAPSKAPPWGSSSLLRRIGSEVGS